MAGELTTRIGSDVLKEVTRLFGDEDSVQINTADILRWINSAQEKIVSRNPVLQDSIVRDLIGGQNVYAYPADRIQYIQSVNFQGTPLQHFSYVDAKEYIANTGNTAKTGDRPLIWWEWASQIYLWPTPTASINDGLQLDIVTVPRPLTTINDPIDLPDRYFNVIVELVMTMAHMLDENWQAAQFTKSLSDEAMSFLSEQENRANFATYPTISVRPEDAW